MILSPYIEHLHYPIVSAWWAGWGWSAPAARCLPETGVVAYDGDAPVAAVWLYLTNSAIGIIDWHVRSPEVRGDAADGYIEACVRALEVVAADHGAEIVFTFARNQHLIKRLVNERYSLADKDVNIYTKRVGLCQQDQQYQQG